jgi:hypothetical protein
MTDPVKDAWGEVAEGFAQLGHTMKDRYRGPDRAGGAGSGGVEASADALRDAFERLVAAGRDIGQRATDVVRDADVQGQVRQAASSLEDALSATVDMIGREVTGWFDRPDPPVDAEVAEVEVAEVDAGDGPTI